MGAPSESESEAKSAKAADMAAAPTATPKGSPSFTDDFGKKGMGRRWAYWAGPTVSNGPMGFIVGFLTSILIRKLEFSATIN